MGKRSLFHRLHIRLAEIYLLSSYYFGKHYNDRRALLVLSLYYIGYAFLLAFTFFQLGTSTRHAVDRLNALTLIRLSITINTMTVFTGAFSAARKEEIVGLGRNGIAFDSSSVYFAQFIALNSLRILFFIPFTAITYPIIGFRACFIHALIFFLILAIQQMAAISVGLLVAALFRDPNLAGIVSSTLALITFIFSGSILIRSETPSGLRWLEYLSISFYAHQALIHNEFRGVTFQDGGSGSLFIKGMSLDVMEVWAALGALLIYSLIAVVLGLISLCWTTRSSSESR